MTVKFLCKINSINFFFLSPFHIWHFLETGFARDSGHERIFSTVPKVIQVQRKFQRQKDFYILIDVSFDQNRLSLRSDVLGRFRNRRSDDTMEMPT